MNTSTMMKDMNVKNNRKVIYSHEMGIKRRRLVRVTHNF